MTRPTHTPPRGASFSVNVPQGWNVIVTAISRKDYMQALEVHYDIIDDDARIFGSRPGEKNDHMKVTLDQNNSLPFKDQDDPYTLDLTFFHSTKETRNAEKVVDNNELSSKIHVLKTAKPPGSFKGPDNVTFIIFVEDTPSQETNTGQYDDAVAMVYCVEKL
ncbi:hypothetical protein CC1G_02492 [Coprinopsis cinerea okayama7|uniref:Uncharacterized protein n=1 Tax=Coprinopsis cinerea (strain Okayama-7 / 130 / ATCC MYA-4618 / FGSC 9003) TaxID=240176 RepID=A8NBN2_COPC7|nr:hypothetical protein CC1G_02492 [Coprinopsis cinerea okayama7\|eukprot:XP_001832230.1 hypothetical protein CC1G_02492 [Coprinopsis cinerea okayama7\